MWCGVLGPLVVRRADGSTVGVGGSARRLLFGALLSRTGRTVPPDVLIEDIWGVAPPRSAAKTLQSHVVRLRHDLGRDESDAVLITERTGYRLVLGPADLDVTQFETGVQDAVAAQAAGESDRALETLDAALGLWRGDAYEEFADAPFSVGERLRLFELRADAQEHRTDIALVLGQAGDLVPELEKRVVASPYRERGWEQLVVALYRAGRQADALGAYRRACNTLAEDLGIDPGPRLRDLETQILRQDRDLLGPRTIAAPVIATPRRDVCPYRGLASYTDADSELFVGRERLTAELVGRLADGHLVVVVGASGTGKSSTLRAGLIAALRAGALPGSASWRSAVTTPADDLATVLTAELDLVVLDQAEELFTRLTVLERRAAVDRLEQFIGAGGRAILALRGDFYGRLAELQSLGRYAQAGTVLVGPLREDELRRVVIEPAQRVGLHVEDALVETVLDDVAGQPAALPMLSAALVRTWENRAGDALTLDGYQRGGGVASAVEATAEDAYLRLDEARRTLARQLLVRLAGREGDSWVRRPMRRADATADADSAAVVSTLAAARLVTITEARVEITHDALLAHWPRLRGWLEERVLAAELLDHLDVATRAWQEADRPESDLYRGARLQSALDWRAAHPDDVSGAEGEFLDASEAAADAELAAARVQVEREVRGRRRLRSVAIGLAAMVVLAGVGVGVALHERSSANRSAREARSAALSADARRLAALSVSAPDIATSSLLAAAAYKLEDSPDTRGALLSAVEHNQSALWRVQGPARLLGVAATSDTSRIAVMDNRRIVYVYDRRTRERVASFQSLADSLIGFTDEDRDIVVYGTSQFEAQPVGRLSLVNVETGRRVRVVTTSGDPDRQPVISSDGHWVGLITTIRTAGGVVVDVYDADDWTAPPRQITVGGQPVAVAVSKTAIAVQRSDGVVETRDIRTLEIVSRVHLRGPAPQQSPALAISPDGTRLAVTDTADPRRVSIISARTTQPLPTQPQDVTGLAFAPDGSRLAVTSSGGSVADYSVDFGVQVDTLAGHAGSVTGIAWTGTRTPTGLYTVGLDGDLISWSISSAPRLVTESGPDIDVLDSARVFGHYAFGLTPPQGGPASHDRAILADLRTGRWSTWSLGLRDSEYVNAMVMTPDARWGLVAAQDVVGPRYGQNHIYIWDLGRHVRVGELALPSNVPADYLFGFTVAISPDGQTAYCALGPRRIGVFALPSGRYLRSFTVTFSQPDSARIGAIPWAVDPQGRLLVYGYDTGPHPVNNPTTFGPDDARPANHRLALVDPVSGRLLFQAGIGEVQAVRAIAWSPDGKWLAVGGLNGNLLLFNAATLTLQVDAGAVEPGFVLSVSFSPDSRTLITGGSSGAVSFWTVPDLGREGQRLVVGNDATYAWYNPAGEVVGFASDEAKPNSSAHRWFDFPARPDELVRAACALAGADITPAQWAQYVGDQPYRHVCT